MSYRVLPAQRVLPASRVLTATRTISSKPTLGVYTTAEAGETLIPHLYDWYLDGIDDYISVADIDVTSFTIALWVFQLATSWTGLLHRAIVSKGWYTNPAGVGGVYTYPVMSVSVFLRDYLGSTYSTSSAARVFELVQITATSESRLYFNGVLVSSTTVPNPINTNNYPWQIARDPIEGRLFPGGYISTVILFSRVLDSSEVIDVYNKILNTDNMVFFLDPTFFDGVKYIDLSSNGNHGYPYGGVSRVPASMTWFWRVRGLYQGDKVKVLIPPMTRYRVGAGSWQVNDTWNMQEILVDPGNVAIALEGL